MRDIVSPDEASIQARTDRAAKGRVLWPIFPLIATGPGPVRKFVKFFKKLRFRQIQFRITFRTDGSGTTAPVQIFTLSTYMAEKQTVSRTVS